MAAGKSSEASSCSDRAPLSLLAFCVMVGSPMCIHIETRNCPLFPATLVGSSS